MSLALVLGGLGTPIFEKFCEIEYQNSIMIIRTSLQWNQYRRHELDHGLNNKKKQVKYMKNDRQKKIFEIIRNEMSSEERKKKWSKSRNWCVFLAQNSPDQRRRVNLNKQSLWDLLPIRNGPIKYG